MVFVIFRWYDLGVLILNDPKRQITLQTFTQMTPVPAAVVALAQEDTPNDYPLKWSGYSVTIGSLMARNLQVSPIYVKAYLLGKRKHQNGCTKCT